MAARTPEPDVTFEAELRKRAADGDRVARALLGAPLDSQPTSPEGDATIARAKAEHAAGAREYTSDEVRATIEARRRTAGE